MNFSKVALPNPPPASATYVRLRGRNEDALGRVYRLAREDADRHYPGGEVFLVCRDNRVAAHTKTLEYIPKLNQQNTPGKSHSLSACYQPYVLI
jgi:hypothetical protein